MRGYDQWKTASPYDDEPDWLDIKEYPVNTDPYGKLEFVIGSEDDFVCFDYQTEPEQEVIILHAVLNCETGSFIQDFSKRAVWPIDNTEGVMAMNAAEAAKALVEEALDWCAENDVEHDAEGWNQDPYYFARYIESLCKTGGRIGHADRGAG